MTRPISGGRTGRGSGVSWSNDRFLSVDNERDTRDLVDAAVADGLDVME